MNSLKKLLLPLTVVLLLVGGLHGQGVKKEPIKVLFVGNSFTFFNNLPQMVAAMADTTGFEITTRQSTVSGSNLKQHWKEEKGTKTRKLLEQESWDYVVFNNHSRSSIDTPDEFMEYGEKFASLVKEKGAKPIFMITWAYESNPLMQEELTRAHMELVEKTNSGFVPCGALYAKARTLRPDLDLFFDDKHPSPEGTYLLGLAFYKYFTAASPLGIPKRLTTQDQDGETLYLVFMSQENADFLQQLVDEHEFKLAD